MFVVVKRTTLIILALTAVLVALELGLRLRIQIGANAVPRTPLAPSAAQNFKVLVVADSILGFLNEPQSASARLAQQLGEHGVKVYEFSAPALTTQRVIEGLPVRLAELRPHLVLLMISKSDFLGRWIDKKWLGGSRVVRALVLFIADLKFRWIKMRVGDKRMSTPFDLAWKYYGENEFALARDEFESQLPKRPFDVRAMRAVHRCYRLLEDYQRGISFFESLVERNANNRLAKGLALGLKREWEIKSGQESAKTIEELISHLESESENRAQFKAMQWLNKSVGKHQEFLEAFRQQSMSQSEPLRHQTIKNLSTIVDLVRGAGAEAVLLQYPTDLLEVLKLETSGIIPPPPLWGSREVLLEISSSQEFMDLIDEDIEHLTPKGSHFVADKLASWILNNYLGLN